MISQINGDGSLVGEYFPNGDFKTCKRKLSWIANVPNNAAVLLTEFDYLVTKEKLEKEDRFEDYVNPTTIATTRAVGDAGLKTLQRGEIIQPERRGFFRLYSPYVNSASKPIVLYMVPDGKAKAMEGLTGQLAHH
jgi:glutamyl-tRNA synthetase